MTKEKSDNVNHPKHYNSHPSGIECIQITRHMGFNLGNAFKYIWRADLKGSSIEDLKKAIWYINDEIKKREEKEPGFAVGYEQVKNNTIEYNMKRSDENVSVSKKGIHEEEDNHPSEFLKTFPER